MVAQSQRVAVVIIGSRIWATREMTSWKIRYRLVAESCSVVTWIATSVVHRAENLKIGTKHLKSCRGRRRASRCRTVFDEQSLQATSLSRAKHKRK